MTSIFWDSQGVIITYYLEHHRKIYGAYYIGVLRWLCQVISRKRQGKLTGGVLLLQDNGHVHTPQVTMAAATECRFEILPHSPYSPDISPYDFYMFPKLKCHLRGKQYESHESAIEAENEYLGDQEKAFFDGIRKLEQI